MLQFKGNIIISWYLRVIFPLVWKQSFLLALCQNC